MNRHFVRIVLDVEVDAFEKSDALEAVRDAFGENECGLDVVDLEVIDHAILY